MAVGDLTNILNAMPEVKNENAAKRESYVDDHGIEIIVLTPLDGSAVRYFSTVQLQSTQGPVTVQFPLAGVDSIQAACASWQEAARAAIKATAEQMRKNERRIVLPGNETANTKPARIIN